MSGPDLAGARLKAAAHLMEAIAACHRADRAVLLCAALDTMATGEPGVAFLHIRQEAEDWAKFATLQKLEAYLLACAARLGRTPITTEARLRIAKRLGRLSEALLRLPRRGAEPS